MTYKDRFETLKHACKVSLENYERNTQGMTPAQKAAYTELWMEGAKNWIAMLGSDEE